MKPGVVQTVQEGCLHPEAICGRAPPPEGFSKPPDWWSVATTALIHWRGFKALKVNRSLLGGGGSENSKAARGLPPQRD